MVATVGGRELKKIAEGREAEIFAWDDGCVLRLFRESAAAGWMQREITAMKAVRALLGGLVPEVRECIEIMGRPGIVMQRIDGPDLLTLVGARPWLVWRIGRICGETQARLHDVVAPPEIESLKDRGRRVVPRSSLVPSDVSRWGLGQLDGLPDGDRLLHGDFHPGNVLLSSGGPIVIDWPNVTAGDPDADLARTLLMIGMGSLPPGSPIVVRVGAPVARRFLRMAYVRAYRRHRPFDAAAVTRWIGVRAVDRLTEGISKERDELLAVIARAMNAA